MMITSATDFRLLQQLKKCSDSLTIESMDKGWMVVATKGKQEVTEYGTLFQCITAILTEFGVAANDMDLGGSR